MFGSVAPKLKMAENLHRIDRHHPKIGLNPNFLRYRKVREEGQICICGFICTISSRKSSCAKNCIKYPFESRTHLKRVLCLWFQTSDHFETWLIPSGTTLPKSVFHTHLKTEPILKQCAGYGSRPPIASKPGSSPSERYGTLRIMIWRNLPLYHLWWCLLPLCHALFV